MGLPAPSAAALHRTRQADAERLYRKLQRQVPRRVSQRQLLLRSRRCAAKDRDLEDAVQLRTPTSEPGLSNPGGVRDRWENNQREATTRTAWPAELAGALQSVSSSVEESISLSTPASDRAGGWGRKAISGQ